MFAVSLSRRSLVGSSKRSLIKNQQYKIQRNYHSIIKQHIDNSQRVFRRLNITRNYARRRRVSLKDPEVERQRGFELERQREEDLYYRQEFEEDNRQNQDYITPDVRDYLSKVYFTLTTTSAAAALGAIIGIPFMGFSLIANILGFLGVLYVSFSRSNTSVRKTALHAAAALLGMGISPLIAASAPGAVFAAGLGTLGIFGGFTLAALKAKRKSTLQLQGFLFAGLMAIIVFSLAHLGCLLMGVTNPAILGSLYNITTYGGLAIFSLFIAYDTGRMIEMARKGLKDYVGDALSMFLNLLNIFVRLLDIFRR